MENGNMEIPVSKLMRWEGNPRPQTAMEQNADIEASIEAKGVILPLIVRASRTAEGMYEVIAGDRRRTTVHFLVDQGRWPEGRGVPCIVRTDLDDDADALDVATTENLHLPMHPMSQFLAFSKMVAGGKSHAEIASSYGVTTRIVEQRLSFARLDPRARDLVLRDARDLRWAAAMTLASPQEQAEILDEIRSEPARYRNEAEVQRRLATELVPVSYALFDLSQVTEGLVRRDIFDVTEPSYLPVAEFLRLQDAAVARLVEERRAEGWSRVTVASDRDFDRWQYDDGVEDKAQGEVVFVRSQNGEVVEHSGLTPRVKAAPAETVAPTAAEAEAVPAVVAPEADPLRMDGKGTLAYLEKNRALAVQAMLMGSDPRLAIALTILGLLSESAPKILEGRAFSDIRSIDPDSHVRSVVDGHREEMAHRLRDLGVRGDASYDDNLAALMAGDLADLLRIHQVLVATRVCTGLGGVERLFDAAVQHGSVPVSSVWRPDRTYLDTLTSDQLKALSVHILPERLWPSVKGRKTDMVDTLFRHVLSAHDGSGCFDDTERGIVISWAPPMLGGGTPGIVSGVDGETVSVEDHAATC